LGKVIWYAGGRVDWKNVIASHRGVDDVDKASSIRWRKQILPAAAAK